MADWNVIVVILLLCPVHVAVAAKADIDTTHRASVAISFFIPISFVASKIGRSIVFQWWVITNFFLL